MPLTLKVPKTKLVEFANSVEPDEVAHNEPPHLDLHCLSTGFLSSQSDIALTKHVHKFCHLLFCVCVVWGGGGDWDGVGGLA